MTSDTIVVVSLRDAYGEVEEQSAHPPVGVLIVDDGPMHIVWSYGESEVPDVDSVQRFNGRGGAFGSFHTDGEMYFEVSSDRAWLVAGVPKVGDEFIARGDIHDEGEGRGNLVALAGETLIVEGVDDDGRAVTVRGTDPSGRWASVVEPWEVKPI